MPASLSPPDSILVLALALLAEAAFGYPDRLYRAIGHPVTWIGALIAALDRRFNRDAAPAGARRRAGVLALLVLVAVVAAGAGLAAAVLAVAGRGAALVLAGLLAASLLAQRSLHDHVGRVAEALRADGLEAGREAVSHIVGRNPGTLDEAAVCRAAIESLAENFSDGVVAPALWTGAGGLLGGILYKAVNTADSMIGHRTPRHEAFGWAAARLDDLVNLPASRLAAALIAGAALLRLGPAAARAALRAVVRDARHHRSPNAGWPEAAMAGALALRLAGPRVYGATRVEDRWMGDGRAEATPDDIDRALAVYRTACGLLWTLVLVLCGAALAGGA